MEKLKAQNEYLDAIASNNIPKLREIYSKYSSKRRPTFNDTPATFDTPATQISASPVRSSVRSNKTSSTTVSRKTIGDQHTLDSFFDKYTSEDNDSFEEIIEAAEIRLKQKFAILYEAEDSTCSLQKNYMALPDIDKQFESTERPKNLDMWTYKNKNYLMYIPDGVEFTQEEKVEMAKRKMEIEHSNTRLSANPFNDNKNKEVIAEAAKSNAKGNQEKIGLDGLTLVQEIPQIRGFSFVKTPSPAPSILDSTPLMTWGEIEGSPFRLDASDTPLRSSTSFGGPSFKIAETSKREALALQLAESVSEKHREKKMRAMETAKRNMCASPHVRNSLDRLASMSPAARRLSNLSRRDSSWTTPSPRTPKTTPLVKVNTPNRALIREKLNHQSVRSSDMQTPFVSGESTLTDNLLDIPVKGGKRSKAADYF